ncbi:PREDICTED: RING finger protein nhl-1-like [Amphimedon queenslandica]|uniref:RING-type domain-containing protein n=1 Tax=Amphimedon queenslandica TaxID=400682 RepID=A0AAN0JPM4_AMPQE|nr:PREDICTED: RING finger protein nhl-1-like [Amphimedon queenslandica]|eukprot:XP_019858753.1 PREDICTED: RING finger protein nhl-1-like [Amphimedon queenslandica]
MATKPSSSSSPVLLKLEEWLTCPVCLEHFTNPKILPCHHSFCQHCLEGLPLDWRNDLFCPTCRHRTELPEEGAGAFPVAFHLNNLKEMQSLMKKTSVLPNLQEATCSDHGKPLEFFCETCDTVICSHCLVHNHKHHEYDLITDSYTKHCQKLRECLLPVEGKKEALKNVLQGLVYVTDYGNHRIQKFSSDGKFMSQFGTYGSYPGQTVAFTSDGVFVNSFGSKGNNIEQFICPSGLAFDKDGFLHVCDFNNDRLAVY